MFCVRQESKHDHDRTGEIIAAAFKQQDESSLVTRLRENKSVWVPDLSLVATRNQTDVAIGFILFTISKIGNHSSLVLAPLAVDPVYQASGVGKALIKEGIRKATELGFRSVNVLGHKDYYSKFGFEPASKYNITCPFDLPDPDVFQIMALVENGLDGVSGKIEYAGEFVE
ncbi:GNAT family N-acetyltransferase [Mucor lusitanicus]|uniref:N-acetyltransferase domain-containing protein n=2 Tax=Mucor circinelloides f. lusitanicus TaxID=29924 RepID=A0A168N929_MUCCL